MYNDKKRIRQFLELISAICGLLAAIMYFYEISKKIDNDE